MSLLEGEFAPHHLSLCFQIQKILALWKQPLNRDVTGQLKKNSFSSVGNQCVGSKFKIFYSSYRNSNSYATISISIKTTYLQKKASTAHGETHLQTYLKLRYLSGMVTFSSETLLF